MHINKIENNKQNFNGFLNSKFLTKSLEFAADNGALFAAGTGVVLSTIARPVAILSTPNVEKENKQYACAKSIASSLVNFGLLAIISTPIVKAVKNISNNPTKYLNEKSIKIYSEGQKNISKSGTYKFASQIFKLSSAFISAFPKAFFTCALIPPVMGIFFRQKKENISQTKNISFGAKVPASFYQAMTEKISKGISKILNWDIFQKFAQKYKDTNVAQHMFVANDILLTGLFIKQTKNNKNIKESRKKTLIYNASIMTALAITGGYTVDKLLEKPTQIFIEKFKQANANNKNLDKCIEGIKIAKPALILGGLYYILAPMVSTMLAEIATNNTNKN